ncbi:hypothetical protein [Bradyrhizobium sp. ARR65]|uniref:hypothetical protein n=1 Tax=Bradyrhizobium sp. ARR65 TaxID=1040989 RepID=UPI0004659C21|nr:hypothetical protein [Bradyrhizobium sp. ARR65]
MPSRSKPHELDKVFWPDDSPQIQKELAQLKQLQPHMTRKTKWHVKIDDVNYYPHRGTITIDPDIRNGDRGFEALLELLKKRRSARS